MTQRLAIHRYLGWSLLLAGIALGCWLDPQLNGAATGGTAESGIHSRQAQFVLFEMGLLQFLLPALTGAKESSRSGSAASWLFLAGSASYSLGWVAPAGGAWLACAGVLANSVALVLLLPGSGARGGMETTLLAVSLWGIGLDALLAASAWGAGPLIHLSHGDSLALRLLRLARIAAVALPLLTVHYHMLLRRTASPPRAAYWAGWALLLGSAGMPVCLTAALVRPELKYLLPLPADAVFVGAWAGVWLVFRSRAATAWWPWVLVSASITAGMLMGGYSFNGPLPAPHGMEAYNDLARQCVRLAHTYALVFGLSALAFDPSLAQMRQSTQGILLGGVVLTLGLLLARIAFHFPPYLLALGPALVCAAFFLALRAGRVPVSSGPGVDRDG